MFNPIGCLIKICPWHAPCTLDSGWDEHEELTETMVNQGIFRRNELSLLEPTTSANMQKAITVIDSTPNAVFVQANVESMVAEQIIAMRRASPEFIQQDRIALISIGYDVIDAHGLFTFLNHPLATRLRSTEHLFSIDSLEQAREMQELAGYIAPEHSPYLVVEVQIQKNRGLG